MNHREPLRRWDIFCRIIDNFGDAAVCWRLARQLALEWRFAVRLWIDQPEVLKHLQPNLPTGDCWPRVTIRPWKGSRSVIGEPVADVVIAAFGCELPTGYRQAMRSASTVWINLEYFSAEPWTAGVHGLPSPKPEGGVEHFFFPGLGAGTGGMLRESSLLDQRDAFVRDAQTRNAFLAALGVHRPEPVSRVSVFCYPSACWRALLDALEAVPPPMLPGSAVLPRWQVLIPEGVLVEAMPSIEAMHRPSVIVQRIPFLSQDDYDRLLWSCDLNLVRGEDSLVRALWAGRPMLWQAYPQRDRAHLPKVEAWLDFLCGGAGPTAEAWLAWNDGRSEQGVSKALASALSGWSDWELQSSTLSEHESNLPDLATRLVPFVRLAAQT